MSPGGEEMVKDDAQGPRRRGPRKESEVRAEVQAQMREEMKLELAKQREELLAELKAERDSLESKREELDGEKAAMAAFEAQIRKTESVAEQAKPVAVPEVDASTPGAVTVNFVEDGLTLLGKVWYVGEELTIVPETPQWEEAIDRRTGRMLLTFDEDEQIERWGRRFFRPGHWKGTGFDLEDPNLTDEERLRLQSIQDKRMSRTAAPSGSTTSQKRSPVAYS